MKTPLILVIILLGTICYGQNLKEGAVIVLIPQEQVTQNMHSVSIINGRATYKFIHPVGRKIFEKHILTKFERTYPGVEKYDHPNSKILSRYYTIEGNFKRDKVMYDIINGGSELFEDVEPVSIEAPLFIPNDYDLQPVTQGPHAHLDLVNAKQAWDITKGSRLIKVAVTDPNGFFFGHPDYVNSNGTNQILVKSPLAKDLFFSFPGPAHGLNVASTVAMATDNNLGISAIGYNTGLMAFSSGLNQMLSAAYDYQASIVEASWFNSCTYSPSEQLVIDMIYDKGTVIVVAAGNGNAGSSCPSSDGQGNGLTYPSSYNHVISVGGVDPMFNPDSYFRNTPSPMHLTFNEGVDVTAPGWEVGAASVFLNPDNTLQSYGYSVVSGTSFAAPMVAGLAALILAIDPTLSPEKVEKIIKLTSKNIDGLPGNEVYAGKAGSGRIDAFAAVKLANECYGCNQILTLPIPVPFPFVPSIVSGCQIQIQNYNVVSGQSVECTASRQVTLKPGFTATAGSTLRLKISDNCKQTSTLGGRMQTSEEVKHISYRELIESGKVQIPEDDLLEKQSSNLESFPNPGSSQVTFKYVIENPSMIKLSVYDLSGDLISVIVNEYKETGDYEKVWDISELSSGTYLYVLETHYAKKINKLVIAK
jgi:subtilisin family serine protease